MKSTASARERYSPETVPTDPERLASYLSREFEKIANVVNADVKLEVLHVAPSKPREGLVVAADGTDWQPLGAGGGIFAYFGGVWVKLNN